MEIVIILLALLATGGGGGGGGLRTPDDRMICCRSKIPHLATFKRRDLSFLSIGHILGLISTKSIHQEGCYSCFFNERSDKSGDKNFCFA